MSSKPFPARKDALRNEALIKLAYVCELAAIHRATFSPKAATAMEEQLKEALKHVRDNSLNDSACVRCMISYAQECATNATSYVEYRPHEEE